MVDTGEPRTQPQVQTQPDSGSFPRRIAADFDVITQALDGYAFGALIGRGGVGEVVSAHDLRIGREVAIKRLLIAEPTEDEANRFLREARIQARLDHPGIPPVYELGADTRGRPYFAMKRLVGETLASLLARPDPNVPRLLRAFVEVCNAIDFAHTRGVVHRDLKPANIILGDFGDTYVLDWGLARVVGEAVANMEIADIDALGFESGPVLGTPGYMAPEQLRRGADAGRPADVYALGAILFEILTGERLHHQRTLEPQSETIASPSRRRPDRAVPPELDALCIEMLDEDPALRPTVRAALERVGAFLDGDRDVVRRRELAIELVDQARASYDNGERAEAMSAAGRALALNPESRRAAELVTKLMLEPPRIAPAELAAAIDRSDLDGTRRHARIGILAYIALASFFPFAIWAGVRKWDAVVAVFVAALAMAVAAYRISRKPRRSFAAMVGYAVGNAVLIALLERMAGPFTFVPGITCVMIMSVMAYPAFTARSAVLMAIVLAGYVVPITLEHVHALPLTWDVYDGMLISHAGAVRLEDHTSALIMLGAASVMTMLIAGLDAARMYRASRDARHQLVTQAWHLQQLLPASTRGA